MVIPAGAMEAREMKLLEDDDGCVPVGVRKVAMQARVTCTRQRPAVRARIRGNQPHPDVALQYS